MQFTDRFCRHKVGVLYAERLVPCAALLIDFHHQQLVIRQCQFGQYEHIAHRGFYFTSLAFTRTNRNRTYWQYGLDYQIKEYTYENKAIPKAQFTGELGYFIPVLSDKRRNVCFRIGLSALGGFETVNWGTSLLPDGAAVTNGDSFIYGGALTAAFAVSI